MIIGLQIYIIPPLTGPAHSITFIDLSFEVLIMYNQYSLVVVEFTYFKNNSESLLYKHNKYNLASLSYSGVDIFKYIVLNYNVRRYISVGEFSKYLIVTKKILHCIDYFKSAFMAHKMYKKSILNCY